ncbi:hypothetical protein BCR43DRAFT_492813 [Syncephalastrum racemosum]|uniref:Extracellular membrane protein CFEM domain-containing protein n=1 Tax=Syncephalastrum racemosum TaxID=13706 RepID=A0A1X2H9K2_SYNRA|nr:hypothetical protein BCR43DRAFT_492813 [Syncephalastrum racemosum]
MKSPCVSFLLSVSLSLLLLLLLMGGIVYAYPGDKDTLRLGTCRSDQEKMQCEAKCEQRALQPLCMDSTCYCASIGGGSCADTSGQDCDAVCATVNHKTVGCIKDECICDKL